MRNISFVKCPYVNTLRKEYLYDLYCLDNPAYISNLARTLSKKSDAIQTGVSRTITELIRILFASPSIHPDDAAKTGVHGAVVFGADRLDFLRGAFGFDLDNLLLSSPTYALEVDRVRRPSQACIKLWPGEGLDVEKTKEVYRHFDIEFADDDTPLRISRETHPGIHDKILSSGIGADPLIQQYMVHANVRKVSVDQHYSGAGNSLLKSVVLLLHVPRDIRDSENKLNSIFSHYSLNSDIIENYNFCVLNTQDDPLMNLFLEMYGEFTKRFSALLSTFTRNAITGDVFTQTDDYLSKSRILSEYSAFEDIDLDYIRLYPESNLSIVSTSGIDLLSRIAMFVDVLESIETKSVVEIEALLEELSASITSEVNKANDVQRKYQSFPSDTYTLKSKLDDLNKDLERMFDDSKPAGSDVSALQNRIRDFLSYNYRPYLKKYMPSREGLIADLIRKTEEEVSDYKVHTKNLKKKDRNECRTKFGVILGDIRRQISKNEQGDLNDIGDIHKIIADEMLGEIRIWNHERMALRELSEVARSSMYDILENISNVRYRRAKDIHE